MRIVEIKTSKRPVKAEDINDNLVVHYGKVESDTGEIYNLVQYMDGSYGCTCLGKLYHRHNDCKHILLFSQEVEAKEKVEQEQAQGFWKPDWCNCSKGRTGDPVYFGDNACACGMEKHHYHCRWCGNVVQIG
jgi:hypothetical protein